MLQDHSNTIVQSVISNHIICIFMGPPSNHEFCRGCRNLSIAHAWYTVVVSTLCSYKGSSLHVNKDQADANPANINSSMVSTRTTEDTKADKWAKGQLVEVKTAGKGWSKGFINKVWSNHVTTLDSGDKVEGQAIEVLLQKEDGSDPDEIVKWQNRNCDPIPRILYGKYLRRVPPEEEDLALEERRLLRVLKHTRNQHNIDPNNAAVGGLDSTLDTMLIGNEYGDNIGVVNLIKTLTRKKACNEIIKAFGNGDMTVLQVMAHLVGKAAVAEMAKWDEGSEKDNDIIHPDVQVEKRSGKRKIDPTTTAEA